MNRNFRRLVLFGILGCLLLFVATAFIPSVAEIRLDCGDLRYKFLGVPYRIARMPEPDRTTLLSIATGMDVHAHWIPIMPRTTSNNLVAECRDRYIFVAVWARSDKTFGGLLLKDVSSSIEAAAGTRHATTEADSFLNRVAPDLVTPTDWVTDKEIEAYCEKRGYTRPEWKTAAAPG